MSTLYLFILMIGFFYFINTRYTFYTLAFFSVLVYTYPLLVRSSYNIEIYCVYIIISIFLILMSIGYVKKYNLYIARIDYDFIKKKEFFDTIIFIFILISVYNFFTFSSNFTGSKLDNEVGLLHGFRSVLLGFLFLFGVLQRSYKLILFSSILYLQMLVTGDRTQIVIETLVVGSCFLFMEKATVLNIYKRNFFISNILILFLIIFGLFGKVIYGAFYDMFLGYSYFEALYIRIINFIKNPNSVESNHVLNIFSLVVNSNYKIDMDYLLYTPLMFFPFTSGFTINSHFIPEYLKNTFFSGWSEKTGVSCNFFAEGYLSFGLLGAIVFVIIYLSGIFIFQKLLKSKNFYIRFFSLFGGVFWSFYIHRSSLFQIIAHQKRLCISLFVLCGISMIYGGIKLCLKKIYSGSIKKNEA